MVADTGSACPHQLGCRNDTVPYQIGEVATVQAADEALFGENPPVGLGRVAVARLAGGLASCMQV